MVRLTADGARPNATAAFRIEPVRATVWKQCRRVDIRPSRFRSYKGDPQIRNNGASRVSQIQDVAGALVDHTSTPKQRGCHRRRKVFELAAKIGEPPSCQPI